MHVGALKWELRWVTSGSTIHMDLHKANNKWVMCSWSIFGAWTNHGHTQTHNTHHGQDLKKATTFPFIIFFVISHGGYTQMSFCPETPKLKILKFPKLGLLTICKPVISCANLWLWWSLRRVLALVESFPKICGTAPART